jgi:hypothetical protein
VLGTLLRFKALHDELSRQLRAQETSAAACRKRSNAQAATAARAAIQRACAKARRRGPTAS